MSKANMVVHQNLADRNGKVFCKRTNKIETVGAHCDSCPYLYGSLQGKGVECEWKDVMNEVFVEVESPKDELLRVSSLIDAKILKKG